MEILGRERRRRWSNAEKLEIVAAVGMNGETLARVARRYDVSRSQIYQWRHLFRKRGLLPAADEPTFLPVDRYRVSVGWRPQIRRLRRSVADLAASTKA